MIDPCFKEYCQATHDVGFDPDHARPDNPAIPYAEDTLRRWRERIPQLFPKLPKLCMGFVEDHKFGAFADLWNGMAVIGISTAVPVLLENLVIATMSHPNGLAQHGEAVTIHPKGIRLDAVNIVERLFNSGELLTPDRYPPISRILLNFIVLHELTHITHGHVDLFKKPGGLAAMEEMVFQESDEVTLLDRHTIEWDSDKTSQLNSSNVALSTLLGRPYAECARGFIQEGLRGYHVFLYLLFKLMEAAEPKTATRVHPKPILRISFLLAEIWKVAKRLEVAPLPEHFARDVLVSGEVAWGLITNSAVVEIHGQMDRMQDQTDDAIAVIKGWPALQQRLAPYYWKYN